MLGAVGAPPLHHTIPSPPPLVLCPSHEHPGSTSRPVSVSQSPRAARRSVPKQSPRPLSQVSVDKEEDAAAAATAAAAASMMDPGMMNGGPALLTNTPYNVPGQMGGYGQDPSMGMGGGMGMGMGGGAPQMGGGMPQMGGGMPQMGGMPGPGMMGSGGGAGMGGY